MTSRVRFLGEIAHDTLSDAYRAADISLCSRPRAKAGRMCCWKQMASGTPVVATNVNGTPEVLRDPALSVMVEQRSAPALADAVKRLRAHMPDRAAVRAYAEQFSWEETAHANKALFLAAARHGFSDRFNPAIPQAAHAAGANVESLASV